MCIHFYTRYGIATSCFVLVYQAYIGSGPFIIGEPSCSFISLTGPGLIGFGLHSPFLLFLHLWQTTIPTTTTVMTMIMMMTATDTIDISTSTLV